MTTSKFVEMTSEVVLGWRFQLSVRSGVRSAVVLRTMPTSQNRDMGHPLCVWLAGWGATVRGDCGGWAPGTRGASSEMWGFFHFDKLGVRMATSKFIGTSK